MEKKFEAYTGTLERCLGATAVTKKDGTSVMIDDAVAEMIAWLNGLKQARDKLMVIGNGGSAGIASHVAIDYLKNGGIPAQAFNDGAALTCLGNDLGFENVFAKQVEMLGRKGDILLAISSSGQSANILRAVQAARRQDIRVVTMSGFSSNNSLRQEGDLNFYIASGEYGFVELSHMVLCHAVLDIAMGWEKPTLSSEGNAD